MSDMALETAKKCLRIQDVWLHQSLAWMAEDFDPKFPQAGHYIAQHKHHVARATFGELTDDDTPQAGYLFRVYLDLGLRLLPAESGVSPDDDTTTHDSGVAASIEATFVAEYVSAVDPGEAAINAFALRNASYHVWPFWREFVVNHCERMRLPRVMIPTMSLAPTEGIAAGKDGLESDQTNCNPLVWDRMLSSRH
jgi:hypothetical protein